MISLGELFPLNVVQASYFLKLSGVFQNLFPKVSSHNMLLFIYCFTLFIELNYHYIFNLVCMRYFFPLNIPLIWDNHLWGGKGRINVCWLTLSARKFSFKCSHFHRIHPCLHLKGNLVSKEPLSGSSFIEA